MDSNSIVDKKESTIEKELTNSQRILGAVGHLPLMATDPVVFNAVQGSTIPLLNGPPVQSCQGGNRARKGIRLRFILNLKVSSH